MSTYMLKCAKVNGLQIDQLLKDRWTDENWYMVSCYRYHNWKCLCIQIQIKSHAKLFKCPKNSYLPFFPSVIFRNVIYIFTNAIDFILFIYLLKFAKHWKKNIIFLHKANDFFIVKSNDNLTRSWLFQKKTVVMKQWKYIYTHWNT